MSKKKFFALALVLTLGLALCACGPAAEPSQPAGAAEKSEPIVFAAASMEETLTELGGKYMEQSKNVSIVFNFDSSGTLKTQIQEGAGAASGLCAAGGNGTYPAL